MFPVGANSKLEINRRWIFVLVSIHLAVALAYYFLIQLDVVTIWFLTVSPFIFWLPSCIGVYQRRRWGYRLLQLSSLLALGSGFYGLVLVASLTGLGDAMYNIFLVLISVQVAIAFAVVSLSSSSLKSFSAVADEPYRPAESAAPVLPPQETPIISPPLYQTADKLNESRVLAAKALVAIGIGIAVVFPRLVWFIVGVLFCGPYPNLCSEVPALIQSFFTDEIPFLAVVFMLGAISGWICAQSIIHSFRKSQQWPRGYYGAIFGLFWGALVALAFFGFGSFQILMVPFLGIVGMGVGFFVISAIYQMVRGLVLRE